MNFEEQISAFMDGALSAQEESDFLHILSVSPEKRALFHSYMGVRSAITADARSAAVPTHLDKAVLGAAAAITAGGAASGGAVAGAAAGGAAATGAIVAGAGWWTASRIVSAVVLGLSLFGAGFFLQSQLNSPGSDATRNTAVTQDRQSPDEDARAVASEDAGRSKTTRNLRTGDRQADGFEGADHAGHGTNRDGRAASAGGDDRTGREATPARERIVYRNVYVTRIDTVFLSGPQPAVRMVERLDTVSIALMQSLPGDRPIIIQEAPRQTLSFPLPGHIEVELQREHLNTWPYIDYGQLGVDRAQQQFALAAGYVFDRHHTAGIMLGEKSFAMEYYRIQGDSLYLFQQQPALLYGGGFYRFSLPVTTGIVPEVTLQLGGSDLGPMLGGRIGVQFIPFDRVSIVLGANGALLAYRYKDKVFTSHSLGLSYGVRYRF
ncbi:MAG: hypothetical protein JXA28_04305 [Bacteroidetes bacterium]|nr:hypothetical protein [Bacteroidota bacterium]